MAERAEAVVARVVRAIRAARSPPEASEAFAASLEPACHQTLYAVLLATEAELEPAAWRCPRPQPQPIPLGYDPVPRLRAAAGLGPQAPLRVFPLYLDDPGTLLGLFACGGAPCPHCTGAEPLCGSLAEVLALVLGRARELAGALAREARAVDLQRAVVESLPLAVAVCDGRRRLLAANRPFREACHGDPTPGTDLAALLPPGTLDGVDLPALIARAARGEPAFHPRVPHRAPHHGDRVVSLWVTPLRDGALTPGALVALYDVTKEARAEEALTRAQRMESLGRLAAGLAHEFKNLLMTIQGNAELLELHGAEGESGAKRLERIVSACQRASDLAHRVLAFGRGTPPQRQTVGLGSLAHRVAELARPALPKGVDLRLTEAPGPTVEADPSGLEQVLLNLLLNAGEAAGGAGTIEVRVGEAQGEAWIEVADDGPGMAPEVAERVFEPFFTTKGEGKGTGLGLAVVYGIVRDHGGAIELDTAPGRGARFRVRLPRTGSPEDGSRHD
ncbi:two-component system sensor histidine kinase NtrB [Deferrisoma palaeochoriense]